LEGNPENEISGCDASLIKMDIRSMQYLHRTDLTIEVCFCKKTVCSRYDDGLQVELTEVDQILQI
jgi:hypothetical protein